MANTKSDSLRIERVVAKYRNRPTIFDDIIAEKHVVLLLRRELAKRDARVRRIVKGEMWDGALNSYQRCANNTLKAVLAALRGKG